MSMIPAGACAPEELDGFSVTDGLVASDDDRSAAYTLDDDLWAAPADAAAQVDDWMRYVL